MPEQSSSTLSPFSILRIEHANFDTPEGVGIKKEYLDTSLLNKMYDNNSSAEQMPIKLVTMSQT